MDAADLNTLDLATTVKVDASKVTTLTGTAADIETALRATAGLGLPNNVNITLTAPVSVTDANALDALNGTGVITATISDTDIATIKTLKGSGNAYTVTAPLSGTVQEITSIQAAIPGVTLTYSLADTTANINGASDTVLTGATAITVNDDSATTGSILDLGNTKVNTLGKLTAMTIKGDAGMNVVQLSTALSSSGFVAVDFGAGDASADSLVLNTSESSPYTTFDATGAISKGPEAFSFNTISGFSLEKAEDLFGIFYDSNRVINSATQITDESTTLAFRLTDGRLYEDVINLYLSDDLKDPTAVLATIAEFIKIGGTLGSMSSSVGDIDAYDFVYVAYGESSNDPTVTSAYIYSGFYVGTVLAGGSNFDSRNLSVVGLAEIVGVNFGDLQTGINAGVITTKPTFLS
ncbi:MAG: hypothetical protein VKM34_12825 [Cyanobacteriota bacterium]|nr:hypothetical protein [Cyanobacteriota bacterium]